MQQNAVLYDLASRVMEIAKSEEMDRRRKLWTKQNSFHGDRPLIYLRAYAYDENFDESVLRSEDPVLRDYEKMLYETIYRSTLGDDYVIEPWVTMEASYKMTNNERWGVPVSLGEKLQKGGAAAYQPIITNEDYSCICPAAHYEVDEEQTAQRMEKLEQAIGGGIPIFVSRQGPFGMWNNDISTDLAKLRGLEQIMWDAYDRPEWLHGLLSLMRDSILQNHREAEAAGGFSLADNQNQCIPYAEELEAPSLDGKSVPRKALWRFFAAQEFTGYSPDMFWEFMLQYQKPIMEEFGLSAYGCCEDLTGKIPYLRKIKNLRRISVSPFANARRCSEEIGSDYILSWRPNPSLMLATGLDEDLVRKHMREHFAIFKENHNRFDITLKDVETVNHKPENVKRWTQIVREEIERAF